MFSYKRKYIFERIAEQWGSPDITIKDRELLYKKFIHEEYDFSPETTGYLYNSLIQWIDTKHQERQEILTWYHNNSYPLFSIRLFCLLAVCAVYKLHRKCCDRAQTFGEELSPLCNDKKVIFFILLTAVKRALHMKEDAAIQDSFSSECDRLLQNDLPVQQFILDMLIIIKRKSPGAISREPGIPGSFVMVYGIMCDLAGIPQESVPGIHSVSVNTLLVYKSGKEKEEKGITATLLLKAIPGQFSELYPVLELFKESRLGRSFLESLRNIVMYIKGELGVWPCEYDICWDLIPDNREITLNNKILIGRSLEAAFILGILKLITCIGSQDQEFCHRTECKELNLKLVAITATVDMQGKFGKVGGIWQKLLEAARVKIGFVIVSHDQTIAETSKLVIIRAKDIWQAIKKLHREIGPESIIEKIKKVFLKYATETKELENRCNEAFNGDDLTNIKGAVRFNDKPRVYVEDLIDICLHYRMIQHKHPIEILLEKIEKNVPPPGQDEFKELRILFNKSFPGKKQDTITQKTTVITPTIMEKRVIINEITSDLLKRTHPPLNKKGNPYVNRTMILHPEHFFGRKKEIKWLKKRICTESPQSVSLLGERRIGKSSLLNYLTFLEGDARFLDEPGKYIFIFMDCQGLRSIDELQFLTIIFSTLKKKLKNTIKLKLKNDFDDLRFLCDEITAKGLKLVLLFDEFESITKNNHFTPAFYSLLRSLANNYSIALITSSVRNLKDMCGSREISDSPFFNIFAIQHIGLFTRDEAKELITNPSLQYGISLAGLDDRIITESGVHPFFLQIMCCSWFDFLEAANLRAESMINKKTPKEVLYHFREEAGQHFEFIYDTMHKKERMVIQDVLKGNDVNPDSHEVDVLEQKGYVIRRKDDTLNLFCSEFERFISQYCM